MSILEELYAGNIQPNDGRVVNPAYKKAQNEKIKCYNLLREQLKEENLSLLETLCDSTADMEDEFGFKMFKLGFSIALQLSAESFSCKI